MAGATIAGTTYGGASYTSSTMTVTAPAEAVPGALLVLGISWRTLNSTPTTHTAIVPTGWDQRVNDQTANGNDDKGLLLCTRTFQSGDSGWSATYTGTGATRAWLMLAIDGADGTTPVAQAVTQKSTADTANHTNPTMTTGADNALRLDFWTDHLTGDGTLPGSMTHVASHTKNGTGSIVFEAKVGAAYELVPTASATGTRTFTDNQIGGDDYVGGALEIAAGATAVAVSDLTFGDMEVQGGVARLALSAEALTSGEAALDEEGAHLVDLVITSPYDSEAQAETTLYLANGTYTSAAADTPASREFDVYIPEESPISISLSIFRDNVIGGRTDTSFGEVGLFNARETSESGAADLDDWGDYFWDDRSVEILRAGTRKDGTLIPLSAAVCLQKARGDAFQVDGETAQLLVRDLAGGQQRGNSSSRGGRLDRKVQTVRFEGDDTNTGGPAEIEGRPCPIVLGTVHNLSPVMTNRADRVYLFHRDSAGNTCQSVDAAYIGGNLVDSGDYVVDLASGTVQLDVSLEQGKAFTLDVTGPSAAGSTVEEFVTYLTTTIGPLDAADLSSRNAVFRALYPGAAGLYVNDEVTIAETLDALLLPGNYWTIDADGLLEVGQWSDPSDDFVDYTLEAYQIESVTRVPAAPPARTLVFGYDRNYTPITEDGLVDAARSTARGQYALEPYRRLTIDDTAVDELWPSAQQQDPKVLPLVYEADAQAELDRYWGYSSIPWRTLRVVTGPVASRFRLGRVVQVTWPRFGLSAGAAFRIAAVQIDGLTTTLTLWRPSDVTYIGTEDDLFHLVTEADEPLLAT